MKMVLLYYKELHSFNLPFSVAVGLLGLGLYGGFLLSFAISLVTAGFVASIYFYEVRFSQRYYFYYNRGFSKVRLIAYAFAINISLISIYIVAKNLL